MAMDVVEYVDYVFITYCGRMASLVDYGVFGSMDGHPWFCDV